MGHFAIAPLFPFGIKISKRFNNWISDVLTLVSLGTIRGFALFIVGRELEIPNTVINEFRILNSAIAFPTWFIFFALVTEARHQYQQEFNNLFRQISDKADMRLKRKGGSLEHPFNSEVLIKRLQSITTKLGSEIQQALNDSTSKTDYTIESQQIQNLIDSELRPTSKQLWQGGYLNIPEIRKIDMLRIILLEQKLLINFAILFSAPLLFVGVTGGHGSEVALVQTFVSTLPAVIAFVLIEHMHNRNLIKRRESNLLILGLGWLIPITLQLYLIPEEKKVVKGISGLLIYQTALWVVLLSLLIGWNLYYSINKQRDAVLKSLDSLLKDEKYVDFMTTEFNATRDIELSRYLHGEIQAGLTASVLLLQQASKSGDVVLARKSLENAVKILTQNHAEGYERSFNSTAHHLAQIVTGWSGIADIEIHLEFLDLISQAKTHDVVELIGEGVANAIRHGKATKVTVFDEEEQGSIKVHIRSNASDSPQGKSGLGTEMFNRLALEWKFVSGSGESKLTFSVSKSE